MAEFQSYIDTSCVGCQFRKATQQKILSGYDKSGIPDSGDNFRDFIAADLSLEPEPTNEYDKNAVKVLWKGEHAGYVPKDKNEDMIAFLKHYEGETFQFSVGELGQTSNTLKWFEFTIEVI